MFPHGGPCRKVEVVDLTVLCFAWLPVLRQRRLEPLTRDPEQLTVVVGIHAKKFGHLKNLILGRFVVLWDLLVEHHAVCHGFRGRLSHLALLLFPDLFRLGHFRGRSFSPS